jgi:hypothetical protein
MHAARTDAKMVRIVVLLSLVVFPEKGGAFSGFGCLTKGKAILFPGKRKNPKRIFR